MHDLAPELLEQIFTLACTDGGYTGCSLSLVSKYVGAASRSVRFHSVSITSETAQQLAKFQYCFNRACTAAREDGGRTPVVRHLCMSTLGRDTTERQQHMSNIIAFLRSVSPRLYTLSLLYPRGRLFSESMPPNIECPSFPLLQELTIIGTDPFIPDRVECTLPLYPQVTRLHLIDIHGTIEELPNWLNGGLAPRLTHLRLSSLLNISAELQAFVGLCPRFYKCG